MTNSIDRPSDFYEHGFDVVENSGWFGVIDRGWFEIQYFDWIRSVADQLSGGSRGERNGFFRDPEDRLLFVKQYHHGGIGSVEGDVYYQSPDRFYDELRANLLAREAGIEVPDPVAVFTRKRSGGWEGYFISKALEMELLSRAVRLRGKTDLLKKTGQVLASLHRAGIDHGDFHIKNCLASENNTVVVTDFDPVRFRNPDSWTRSFRVHRFMRSLEKYGFLKSDQKEFFQGYRDEASVPELLFHLQKPMLWMKNLLSDMRYNYFKNRSLESIDFEKVLVRAPNWLGDAVMSLPFIQSLKEFDKTGQVDVVARSGVADLYSHSPSVNKTWTIKRGKSWYLPEEITAERYSLAITIPKSFRTGMQLFRSGIPRRFGFSTQGRSLFLTDRVPLNGDDRRLHHAHLNLKLLERMIDDPGDLTNPRLKIPERVLERANRRLDLPDSYITIHPGSAYGPAKRWPAEQYKPFLKRLISETSLSIVAVGVESERPIARKILEGLPGANVVNLVGKTSLEECMAVLLEGEGTVANDSGIMHLSAALGVPTLGIFGSSSPQLTSPLGPKTAVIYKNVECSPCFERKCPLNSDPYKCLRRISSNEVFDRLDTLINS